MMALFMQRTGPAKDKFRFLLKNLGRGLGANKENMRQGCCVKTSSPGGSIPFSASLGALKKLLEVGAPRGIPFASGIVNKALSQIREEIAKETKKDPNVLALSQ